MVHPLIADMSRPTVTLDPTNALVLAPTRTPLDDTRRNAGRLDAIEDRTVLLVVYGHDPATVRETWIDRVDRTPERLGVVGVGPVERPLDGDGRTTANGRDVLTVVRDPADIAGLGITLSLYLDDWAADDAPTLLDFHSVTAMLDHVDTEVAFRFFHVLTRRLEKTGTSGQFHLDPAVHGETTVRTLEPVFDTVVERDEPSDSIPPDLAFDLLGARRRRYVLYHLLETPEGATVDALAAAIARQERQEFDRIETSLYHVHLPKLENAGVISVTDDRVVPHGSIAALEPYLSLAADHDLPDDRSFPE